jgi:hypothetical protein
VEEEPRGLVQSGIDKGSSLSMPKAERTFRSESQDKGEDGAPRTTSEKVRSTDGFVSRLLGIEWRTLMARGWTMMASRTRGGWIKSLGGDQGV